MEHVSCNLLSTNVHPPIRPKKAEILGSFGLIFFYYLPQVLTDGKKRFCFVDLRENIGSFFFGIKFSKMFF